MGPEGSTRPGSADFQDLTEFSVVARGAHATVYRAYQVSKRREVALKVDSRMLTTPADRHRFEQEAHFLGRLSSHPGIIQTYMAGITAEGNPFTITELCRGSFQQRLIEEGQLAPDEVQRVGISICDALAAAHEARLRHGDIKPANILISMDGRPVLADFGSASIIEAHRRGPVSRASMTPAYAPLETFHMQPSGESGDVYSLAATLYALLNGRPPRFPDEDRELAIDEVMALCTEPIPDIPGVSQVLLGMLRAAMTNNPAGRPTAAQFRDMLESVPIATAVIVPATGHAGIARTVDPAPPTVPFQQVRETEPPTEILRANRPTLPEPRSAEQTINPAHDFSRQRVVEEPPTELISAHMVESQRTSRISIPDHQETSRIPIPDHQEQPTMRITIPDEPRVTPNQFAPPGQSSRSTVDAEPAGDWAYDVPDRTVSPPRPRPAPGAWGLPPSQPPPRSPGASDDDRLPVPAPSRELATRRERRIAERGGEERSGMPKLILVCSVILMIIVGVVIAAVNFLSGDSPPSTETKSSSPVCAVEKFGVSCLPEPQCFESAALRNDKGQTTAKPVDCSEPHIWEAYAVGDLPADIEDPSWKTVYRVELVQQACFDPEALRSMLGASASDWNQDVLPPTGEAFNEGTRTFYCVASLKSNEETTGPAF